MKKEYIKPEVDIVDVELSSMISTSGLGEGDGESDNFDANDRRGDWGNLWD